MLFERVLNETFILFKRFLKHEQLCYLNEFSYFNDLQNMNKNMLFERIFNKTFILFE